MRNPQFVLDEICRYLFARAGIKKADLYLYNYMKKQPQVELAQTKNYRHHEAHAACTFYQSPFDKALVISFDGGGDDGFFNIYKFDSRQSQIDRLAVIPVDLGMAYMIMGHFLADIKREDIMLGNLVYPGKMMGLCAYGKVQKKWLPHFEKFFEKYHADTPQQCMDQKQQKIIEAPKALFEDLEFKDFDFRVDRIEGQKAYDLAATHQHAFEQHFFKLAQPYLDEYKDWPLCLVGGSALNVNLNTKLLEQRKGNMFVPPQSK